MLADTFAFLIKEQQKIILGAHGYTEAVLSDKKSIIPLEIKSKLKEIKDFDIAYGTRSRFSGRGSFSWRGGGFRGYASSSQRWSNNRSFTRSPAPNYQGRGGDVFGEDNQYASNKFGNGAFTQKARGSWSARGRGSSSRPPQ